MILQVKQLNLPPEIAKEIKSERLEIVRVKNGFLLREVKDPIKRAKGYFKGSKFTSQRYMELKAKEKGLE